MEKNINQFIKKLYIIFSILILPSVIFFMINIYIHNSNIIITAPIFSQTIWGITLFVLSVLFGVAVPILLRTYFYTNVRNKKYTTINDYIKFQIIITCIALISPISANFAYLFIVPKLHLYGAVLSALYAIYSVIPSQKKITSEIKYYKLVE